jgi:GTP cyclohydrolase IA
MKSNRATVKVMRPNRTSPEAAPAVVAGAGAGEARPARVSSAAARAIAPHVESILALVGEDPKRQGLLSTPDRVARAFEFLTSGYRTDIGKLLNNAFYEVKYDEMVLVKDIEFFSLCEHHMLPFFGKVHVAYLPKKRVIGLSKIPRIVDAFARRLQIQERLTQEIAQTIQDALDPVGVGVICEARHFCMMMRGVEKQHSGAITSSMLGAFRDRKDTRDEFLALVNHKANGF